MVCAVWTSAIAWIGDRVYAEADDYFLYDGL